MLCSPGLVAGHIGEVHLLPVRKQKQGKVVVGAGREKGGGSLLTAGEDGEKPAITERCEGDNWPEVARGTQRRWFPLWLSFAGEMNGMEVVDGGSRLARGEGNRNRSEMEVAGNDVKSGEKRVELV
jgi:hypothetical protein